MPLFSFSFSFLLSLTLAPSFSFWDSYEHNRLDGFFAHVLLEHLGPLSSGTGLSAGNQPVNSATFERIAVMGENISHKLPLWPRQYAKPVAVSISLFLHSRHLDVCVGLQNSSGCSHKSTRGRYDLRRAERMLLKVSRRILHFFNLYPK